MQLNQHPILAIGLILNAIGILLERFFSLNNYFIDILRVGGVLMILWGLFKYFSDKNKLKNAQNAPPQ